VAGVAQHAGIDRVELGHMPAQGGGQGQPPARPQDAGALAQHASRVGEVVDPQVGDDQIEHGGSERHRRTVPADQGHVAEAQRLPLEAGAGQAVEPAVQPPGAATLPQALGQIQQGEARAAGQIEDGQAGGQRHALQQRLPEDGRPQRRIIEDGHQGRVVPVIDGRVFVDHGALQGAGWPVAAGVL